MAWATYVTGKGIRERNAPFRSAYVFGAVLNAVNTAGWYSPLDIWDPTEAFDLSTITKNHEVVVALVNVTTDGPSSLTYNFQWRRNRDNALLFEGTFSLSASYAAEQSSWCYIGWTDNEISENGGYHVTIRVRGTYSFDYTLNFTVSGIPAVIPAPAPPGNPMDAIFSLVWNIKEYVYNAAETVGGWVWPLCLLCAPLYLMSDACWNLLTPIANFGDWVTSISTSVANVLSPANIISLLQTWLTYAQNSWYWVLGAFHNVWVIIEEWWWYASFAVQSWIALATQGLAGLLAGWNSFWIITFPTLTTWAGIGAWWSSRLQDILNLLNTAFATRQNLWAGWQEVRTSVLDFLANPLEWLWSRFTDWFLGGE